MAEIHPSNRGPSVVTDGKHRGWGCLWATATWGTGVGRWTGFLRCGIFFPSTIGGWMGFLRCGTFFPSTIASPATPEGDLGDVRPWRGWRQHLGQAEKARGDAATDRGSMASSHCHNKHLNHINSYVDFLPFFVFCQQRPWHTGGNAKTTRAGPRCRLRCCYCILFTQMLMRIIMAAQIAAY
jgi:hypothetical protein